MLSGRQAALGLPPGSLAGGPACPDWNWRCPLNFTQISVLPSVYRAAHSLPHSCSMLKGQALCGCYLLDEALLSAIQSGACTSSCEPACQGGASSGAVALVGCQAAAQQPLVCPKAPDPGCLTWRYSCGSQHEFTLSQAQHAVLHGQRVCAADLDFSSCVVGGFIMDRALLEAVQAGNCTRYCSDDLPLPSCAAPPSAFAPGAAGPLVSAGNSHYSAVTYPPQVFVTPPAAAPAGSVDHLYGAPAPYYGSQPAAQKMTTIKRTAALSALLGQVMAGYAAHVA